MGFKPTCNDGTRNEWAWERIPVGQFDHWFLKEKNSSITDLWVQVTSVIRRSFSQKKQKKADLEILLGCSY